MDVTHHLNTTYYLTYYLIYEFKGDNFFPEQIQRMVATVVGIVHGWLPQNFVQLTMDRTRIVESPLAPGDFLFRAGVRFHFAEQNYGQRLLQAGGVHLLHQGDPVEWMQTKLHSEVFEPSMDWVHNLETVVAPRITY